MVFMGLGTPLFSPLLKPDLNLFTSAHLCRHPSITTQSKVVTVPVRGMPFGDRAARLSLFCGPHEKCDNSCLRCGRHGWGEVG